MPLSEFHNSFANLCHFCNFAFKNRKLFNKNKKQHVLSVLDNSRVIKKIEHQLGHQRQQQLHQQEQWGNLSQSAIFSSIILLKIVTTPFVGLLNICSGIAQINDIIKHKASNRGAQGVQFSAKQSLNKCAPNDGKASDTDIYANSEVTPIHHQMSDETFFRIVEMKNAYCPLRARIQWNGWILQKFNELA